MCDFAKESSAEAAFELFKSSSPELTLTLIRRWLGHYESETEFNNDSDYNMIDPIDGDYANNLENNDHLLEDDLALSDTESDLIEDRIESVNHPDLSMNKDKYLSDDDIVIKSRVCMYAAEHSVLEAIEAYKDILPALTPAIVDRWIKSHRKQCQKFPVPPKNTTLIKPKGRYSTGLSSVDIELTTLTPDDAKQHIKRAHVSAMPSYTASFKDAVCRHMESFGADSTREQCKRLGLPINFERVNYWLKQFNEISYVERATMTVGYTTELKIKVCELAMKTSQQKAIKQYKGWAPNLSSSVVSCWMKKYISGGPASLYPFGHKSDPNDIEPSNIPEEPHFSHDFISEVLDYAISTSVKRAVNRYESETPGVTYALIKKWMLEREHGEPFVNDMRDHFNEVLRESETCEVAELNRKRSNLDAIDDISVLDLGVEDLSKAPQKPDDEDVDKDGHSRSLRMVVGEFAYNNGFMATTNEYSDLDTGTIYAFMEEYERFHNNLNSRGGNGLHEPVMKRPRRRSSESYGTQLKEYPELYNTVMSSLRNLVNSHIHLSPKLAKTMATDTIRTQCPKLLPESGGQLILDDKWAEEALLIIENKPMQSEGQSVAGSTDSDSSPMVSSIDLHIYLQFLHVFTSKYMLAL